MFWKKLSEVTQLAFHANTWMGKGTVTVTKPEEHTLIFHEEGTWQQGQRFSNVFRWTLDPSTSLISLEHLRQGTNRPVMLLRFIPSGNNSLISIAPHHCGADIYSGHIYLDDNKLHLNWAVIGPKKNEQFNYIYF